MTEARPRRRAPAGHPWNSLLKLSSGHRAPQLERMLPCGVVIKTGTGRQAGYMADEEIGFGRVQVAARRVAAKCPGDVTGQLPEAGVSRGLSSGKTESEVPS